MPFLPKSEQVHDLNDFVMHYIMVCVDALDNYSTYTKDKECSVNEFSIGSR